MIQTAPDSDPFLGFSGPTNLLVAFDTFDRIVGIDLLNSRDTRDHVELVRANSRFLTRWIGLTWDEAASRKSVDGVAGATLTSMAIVQGMQKRLGNSDIAQKFPKSLELSDAQQLFPNAKRIEQDRDVRSLWHVYDGSKISCGSILRTSPAADEVIGYQGPTETRIAIATDGSIVGLSIAASFDNEPYVGYVKGDAGFAAILKKYKIRQWSELDLKQAGIEGVSGATMTSLAIAQGFVETARRYESEQEAKTSNRSQRLTSFWRSVSTFVIIAAGILIGLTSLRGRATVRVAFQVVLIGYLGFVNGDLLSLAMFHGWVQSGIPWQNALGLVVLAIAALAIPITFRTNIYCSHLCPHGAVQQLLPRRWKRKTKLPRLLSHTLLWIRPLLFAWVLAVSLFRLPFSLVDIEPFDAYSWRAAAWPTVLVAIVGIAFSLKVPMAYCRYGCATGALLNFVRRHSRSDRWTRADWFALSCLILGGLLYAFKLPL